MLHSPVPRTALSAIRAAGADFAATTGPDGVALFETPADLIRFQPSPFGYTTTETVGNLIVTAPDGRTAVVPAIAHYVPEARVVPLVLRRDMTAGEVETLAAVLAPLLDRRTLVVAAVDFSHYLSAEEARQRDRETLSALDSLDSSGILSFGDDHLDSPASLAALPTISDGGLSA